LAASDILAGDLESKTVCRPAETIFGAKIRFAESQTNGHPRPARGFAGHAALNRRLGRPGEQELQPSSLPVTNINLRTLAAGSHLYQLGIELARHGDPIAATGTFKFLSQAGCAEGCSSRASQLCSSSKV
jgi:hypothetical protein